MRDRAISRIVYERVGVELESYQIKYMRDQVEFADLCREFVQVQNFISMLDFVLMHMAPVFGREGILLIIVLPL